MEKSMIKRYAAECIGTCVLVLIGCGAAMSGLGTLTIAIAFGLSIVAMAYSIGNISGCHVNPAVSFAVYMNGGLNTREFLGYVVSQCAGSFIGTLLLRLIFKLSDIKDYTAPEDKDWGMGANTLAGVNDSIIAGFIVEIVLTFIFVIAILGVTSKKANHGSFGGLVIGLTLTLVHILGIGLTGTSVNPARSLFPAIFAFGDALIQVWIFIIAPFIGAGLAALAYKWLDADNK